MFVNLHTHSHYSLLDGLPKIELLVEKAKKEGQKALALTDHGVMYGAVEFYKKCREAGVKPIIGCEIYLSPRKMTDRSAKIDANPYHLVLLAKDKEGYRNLMALVSLAHLQGFYYKPRVDKATLKKYSQGLIALSACLQGEIPRIALARGKKGAEKVIKEYQSIFGKDNFYLEIQPHFKMPEQQKVNQILIALHKEKGYPIVATKDVHYLEKEDRQAHETLLCVQTGKEIAEENRLSMADDDFSFATEREMRKSFPEVPEAVDNSVKIADRCHLSLKTGQFYLPKLKLPQGESASSFLRKKVYQGAKKKYHDLSQRINKRIEYELQIIDQMDYSSYFLIVADFVNFARQKGILVGPGRGSVGGSIVAYSLGITQIDPLRYDLLFERFLNPERISQPDIDLDFADNRRDEVIRYVERKYGRENVAQIITFGKMEARGSIRDVARTMGLSYGQGDRIAKEIPFGMNLEKALANSPELAAIYQEDNQARKVIRMAKKLEGVVRHASVHAAGVVISPDKLTKYTPVQFAPGAKDMIITQYSMYDVEDIGLVKMDFLGLSNLTILQNALEIIEATTHQKIDLRDIPLDDRKTYRLLGAGQTTGVFQLSSSGMKRYLKDLKPTKFEDIIAMVALYRPGPIDSIPDFIAAKHGQKKVRYLHPDLKPILKNTYGVIVYQEQVLEIARKIAGFSYGEADILRKAVGKKIKKLLDEQREKFVRGAVNNKIDQKTADRLWDFIEPFARYGFNKAHAAGYGLIAYWTAYLKANYPAQFMAALMTADRDDLDKIDRDIQEAKQLKIKVLPPDVNESFVNFGVVKKSQSIRFGLSAIKNVGQKAAEMIVKERKKKGRFQSIEDFADRLAGRLNRKILENLSQSGALESIQSQETVLANLDQILKFSQQQARSRVNGQANLFGQIKVDRPKIELNSREEITAQQKLNWEKELLGVYLSRHPLDQYKEKIKLLPYRIGDLGRGKKQEKKKVILAGIITKIKKITTRSNEPMLFVTLEDYSDQVEILVFPSVLKKTASVWGDNQIILVQGSLTFKDRQGETTEPKLLAERARDLAGAESFWQKLENKNRKRENFPKTLGLSISSKVDPQQLDRLKEVLKRYPGPDRVILTLPDGREINTKIKVSIDSRLPREVNRLFSPGIRARIIDSRLRKE